MGQTNHEMRGWGLPGGSFRVGSNAWVASYRDTSKNVMVPITLTAAQRAAVRERFPGAAGPEGVHVSWDNLGLSAGLGSFFLLVTSLWWIGLRGWRWDPAQSRSRNVVPLVLCVIWPWLLGTSSGLALADGLRIRKAPGLLQVNLELAISGTSLLIGVGLVLLLTRRRWPGNEDT